MQSKKMTDADRLTKFKISSERYEQEFGQLTGKGYSSTQAQRIIVRQSSKKTVEALLELHDSLIRNFTHEQLVNISTQNGAGVTLRWLGLNISLLIALKYNPSQIAKVAANGGGARNLDALLNRTSDLVDFGFELDDICQVAANNGGSNNIEAVYQNAQNLLNYGFKRQEIRQIASQHGGLRRIELVDKGFPLLSHVLAKEDILKYAILIQGDRVLEKLNQVATEHKKQGASISKQTVAAILRDFIDMLEPQEPPKKAKKRSLDVSQSSSVVEEEALPDDGENLAAAGASSSVRPFSSSSQTFWSEKSLSRETEEEEDPSIYHHKMRKF